MAVKLQFRRDTAANWETNNPILSEGELGLDTTNQRFKIGDGVNTWDNIEFSQYTNKAETFTVTTTLAGNEGTSDWSQESGGDWDGIWTTTKTVSGILSTDTPFVELDLSNATSATYPDIYESYNLLFRVEVTALDTMKFYATLEPAKDIDLNIKVVR
jgi:hypothetical protein